MKKSMPDILVSNEGSIFLFTPTSNKGREWLSENIGNDAMYFGRSLVVEHRYAEDIANGMVSDGLSVN